MIINLKQSLVLWAGMLALTLLYLLPLAGGWLIAAGVVVTGWMVGGWSRAGDRPVLPGDLSLDTALPPRAFDQPVVLVCGDGLPSLFKSEAQSGMDVRVTDQGCYLAVPTLEQLPVFAGRLLQLRPEWADQLSLMFVVNPGAHSDRAELAGRIRFLCHQAGLVRKRNARLPLLLVSYVQSAQGEGVWFSWDTQRSGPTVRDGGGCSAFGHWQQETADCKARAVRLQIGIQLESAADWLNQQVLPHLLQHQARRTPMPPVACAVALVPFVPAEQSLSLWRQWLLKRTGVVGPQLTQSADLPFPDPLLALLPTRDTGRPVRRAGLAALWMFTFAGLLALVSSFWQNTLLARQVSEDLRHYHSLGQAERAHPSDHVMRERAVAVLHEQARRLDGYYRHGAPVSLSLGLYQGERFRAPLLAAIASYRPAPAPENSPAPVTLDSLALFAAGSARLKPDSTKVLVDALVNIKAQPGWLIVIAGHTDATGSPRQNLELSSARAAAVRDWMQSMGDIPDSCFAVQGFGATQPIATNETEAGRSANRRVDIRLVPEAGACALLATRPDRQPLSHSATANN